MPRSGGTGQGCALVAAQMFVLFLLGLAVDAQTGDRTGLETGDGDLFAAFVANTVGAVVDAGTVSVCFTIDRERYRRR